MTALGKQKQDCPLLLPLGVRDHSREDSFQHRDLSLYCSIENTFFGVFCKSYLCILFLEIWRKSRKSQQQNSLLPGSAKFSRRRWLQLIHWRCSYMVLLPRTLNWWLFILFQGFGKCHPVRNSSYYSCVIGVKQGLFCLSQVCIYILKNWSDSYVNEQTMGNVISFSMRFPMSLINRNWTDFDAL